jgi:calcium/calmodulin-dependent protein kinase I
LVPDVVSHAQKATWHVPPEQLPVAEGGAAAGIDSTTSAHHHHHFLHPNTKPKGRSPSPSHSNGVEDITKEVALKMIPKKKVKGNEESVWGEMEVLKGLDHPNIVCQLLQA